MFTAIFSRDMEAKQMFTERWMDKEYVVNLYPEDITQPETVRVPSAATQMDLETILTEVSQTEKDKHYITYRWNRKNGTNELIYKTEEL